MSRGRGFSRGGYRGRGADSWGDSSSSRGRGFSGPSRGRFNWYKESSGFDSRSRYQSGGVSGERYSSRGRGEDSGYRRYSRVDGPASYSSRDHSHHRSPDSARKRMRTDHGYVQASSGRRSHEGSYGGGNDYSNRYGYSEEKGGYGDERGRGYREERRSAGSFRDRSREDYPHRKSDPLDSMPPPSGAPPRHLSSPRGSYRGRISRGTRGFSRLIARRESLIIRKRSILDSNYSFRKKMLARSQTEALRRLKLQKLRRLKEAALAKRAAGEKDGNKTTEDISDEEEKEETWDEEPIKAPGVDDEDEELEEGETPDKKEKPKVKVKKQKKEIKSEKKDEEREEGEEVDEEEEDVEEEEDEEEEDAGSTKESPSKKSDVKTDSGVHVTIKQDSDARAVSEEGRKHLPRSTISGRPFIRLACPHCFTRCITFKEYTLHLYSPKHINMMRKQSLRLKQQLARMRMSQRQKQRVIEASDEVHGNLASRSNFCPICKLNYRQLKIKHQSSESHRGMKKFLMPYCRVCRIGFKSPMLYENHICSLEHLKRKARLEERMMRLRERESEEEEEEGSGMDEKEVDMDDFMILDSVGNVDESGEEGEDEEGKEKKDKKEGEEKKQKEEINLGSEYVRKVEVLRCELCRLYLPRLDNPDRALSIHCRTRNHLQRYVRYRDDRALRSKAEKIHHRLKEAKEAEAKIKAEAKEEPAKKKEEGVENTNEKDSTEKTNAEGDSPNKKNDSKSGENTTEGAEADGDIDHDLETGMDDKLWADVDKDLGELLREVEPGNKSSDEDDDSRAEGGRYDRFRYSEKGSVGTADPSSEGDNVKTVAEADEGVSKSETGKTTKDATNGKSANEEKKQTANDTAAVTASD